MAAKMPIQNNLELAQAEEELVHYHRAKAKEAPGLTIRWQLAAYWKTTPVHHNILTRVCLLSLARQRRESFIKESIKGIRRRLPGL